MVPKEHVLARTLPGLKHRNTIVFRQPKVYVYWISPNFYMPVSEGWYVHAVKSPGSGFDPKTQPKANWQHCQVHADGLTDLKLHENFSYLFYLTPESATEKELTDSHLHWQDRCMMVQLDDPAIIIAFAAQRIDFDDHGKQLAGSDTFNTRRSLDDLYVFNSPEHYRLGERAQKMIDDWARSGLVEGGAFIDTQDPNPRNWKIQVEDSDDPLAPYSKLFPASSVHWHYILAEKDVRIDTETAMRDALVNGRAAAVSIGDIVMLAGDYFGSFDDMHDPAPRKPVNVMDGVANKDAFAGMILDVLVLYHSSMGFLLSDSNAKKLGQKKWMETVHADEKKEEPRFTRLSAAIDAIRQCLGATRFSEIDILARSLKGGGPIRLQDLQQRAPLVTTEMQVATALALEKTLESEERNALNRPGMDEQFFSMVATNGHYAELALHNKIHFTPDNLTEFSKYHQQALEMVHAHATAELAGKRSRPIPARAIALTAFGLHFLTDSFSAGHMRVPREKLGVNGSLAAKMMHDTDGQYGLQVDDGYHANTNWRALGDDYLDSLPEDKASLWMANSNGHDLNKQRTMFAVLSAFRQLHLMAQWQGAHPRYQQVLDEAVNLDKTLEGTRYDFDPIASGPVRTPEEGIDQLLQFMASLQPKANEEGTTLFQNHPPLYLPDGSLNSKAFGSKKKRGYYRDTSSAGNVMELHLRWHTNDKGDVLDAVVNISQIYYLAQFTQESHGHHHVWMAGGETRLLGDYQSMPKG